MKKNLIGMMMSSVLLFGSASWAFDGPQGRGGRTPPPEAIEVCKDKNEGETVEITTPRGEKIKATCKDINGQLAAVPEGGLRGRGGRPSDRIQLGQ